MNTNEIGQRIKAIRGDETQHEFADRLDVGRATLTRYEKGHRAPNPEFLLKVFYACHVDPLWLLTGHAGSTEKLSVEEQALITGFRLLNKDLRNATMRVVGIL